MFFHSLFHFLKGQNGLVWVSRTLWISGQQDHPVRLHMARYKGDGLESEQLGLPHVFLKAC